MGNIKKRNNGMDLKNCIYHGETLKKIVEALFVRKKTYKWGIIGPGSIANRFADDLKLLPNAELYAVASTSLERAENFRAKHGFKKAFGSYAEMLADTQLDIVYIATTINFHFENAMLCLEAGKAVLCEKSFASNREQVEKMIAFSREKKVFLMEALCTRFIPGMIEMKKQIDKGTIGKIVMLQSNLGFNSPFNPDHRCYNPALGGGSIPDLMVYPVFAALYMIGYPSEIKVVSVPAPTGVDWTATVIMKHRNGEISVLSTSYQTTLDNETRVYGEKGCLKLHSIFVRSKRLSHVDNWDKESDLHIGIGGNGLLYEAAEVMSCLDRGLIESPDMPLSFSHDLISILDEIARKARENFVFA
jgi:predicted dehydrogenase